MEVQKIHPAEEYLRNEKNPTSLYVRISGERRKLFINRSDGDGSDWNYCKSKRKRVMFSMYGQALRKSIIGH
jgi:hypothetical protein